MQNVVSLIVIKFVSLTKVDIHLLITMIEKVLSPITNTLNTKRVKVVNVHQLTVNYKSILPDFSVHKYFTGMESIYVYECLDTNYRFFYPLRLDGDEEFYSSLGKLEWYYLPWKWEHKFAHRNIHRNSRVLEVGAAKGDFIKNLEKLSNSKCTGLELNPDIEIYGKENGVDLRNQTVQEHSKEHKEEYDVVCSFQVLEHVSEVKTFIEAMVDCLKSGGKLIIAVPNNDSFVRDNPLPSNVLNMPPHHVGLWSEKSLEKIANYFCLELVEIDYEPLQEANLDTYIATQIKKRFKSMIVVRIIWKLNIHKLIRRIVRKKVNVIKGHTIIAVYRKKS